MLDRTYSQQFIAMESCDTCYTSNIQLYSQIVAIFICNLQYRLCVIFLYYLLHHKAKTRHSFALQLPFRLICQYL